MIKKYFLQAKYNLRVFAITPVTFFKRVVFGKDPYWKQYFWNKWAFFPKELLRMARNRKTIWIDALGGGEVTQIYTFTGLIKSEFPGYNLILSTNNVDSFKFAANLQALDFVFDIPWDISFVMRKALKAIRPELLIVIDQVRFPVILKEAKKLGIKTVLISAAMANHYYRSDYWVRPLVYNFHRYFDFIGVTEERDKQAYLSIGAAADKIKVTGNMKYDENYIRISEEEKQRLREKLNLHPDDYVFVAGSIHLREEDIILEGYSRAKRIMPNIRLILVPRYMNAVSNMENTLRRMQLDFIKWTELNSWPVLKDEIILVDTFGELSRLYAIASVIFIGNSIFPRDKFALGQNIVEPLLHQQPIFFGKHMNKWRNIIDELKYVWNGLQIETAQELCDGLVTLQRDSDLCLALRNKCREIVERNKDGITNNLQLVRKLINNQERN